MLATTVVEQLGRHGERGQAQFGEQRAGGLQQREAAVVVHHGDLAHTAEQREPLGVERNAQVLEDEEEEVLVEGGLR